MSSYKTYVFEIGPEAFDRDHSGVGILNGGCPNNVKRRKSPTGYEMKPEEGGLSVRVDIPELHRPYLLPSTGEMISDHDLYMRSLKHFYDREKECIEGWQKGMQLENFRIHDVDYGEVQSKAGPIQMG